MPRFDDSLTPIYSIALEGTVMTSTGFPAEELAVLRRRVQYLGGGFTLDMTSDNTHLIAHRIGGGKWENALAYRRPVLKPSYIREMWLAQEKSARSL